MKQHWTALAASLWVTLVAGCAATTTTKISSHPAAQKPAPLVIEVATAEEFVQAIGSDRIIRMKPGEYILSDVKDRHLKHVRWYPQFDGNTLTIRDVKNLTIEGLGGTRVQLLVRPQYVFVLAFEGCDEVELRNLTLGHAPEKGQCACGVIGARNCNGLRITNCDLFGCGTEGLTLTNVHGLLVKDSIVRDCSYGIMTLESCSDIQFVNTRFTGNEEFHGFVIADCRDVGFQSCIVEKNKASQPLFQIVSSSDIRFVGGAIRDNAVLKLKERDDDIAIEGATVQGNKISQR